MILAQLDTWPIALLDYLASQREMLLAYARHDRETMDAYLNQRGRYVPRALMPSNPHASAHNQALQTIHSLLQSTVLRGWHCTRLTEDEVETIRSQGMQLPSLAFLTERLRRVHSGGLINDAVAEHLATKNQADDDNRRGMIWFCFTEPSTAGQAGLERFFRYWGGEALYGSHEHDPVTGEVLRRIGRPCLVEANVSISSLSPFTSLSENIVRRYLLNPRFESSEGCEHEDRARAPIPAANIVRVIFHSEPDFAVLTGCDSWDPPLETRR